MTTFIARFESIIANDWNALKTFFSGKVWPALENFFQNTIEEEVAAIIPILESELPNVVADLSALLTPAGWAGAAAGLVSTAADALSKIEVAGKQVAIESIHTAIGAVLSNAKATVTAMQPVGS